MLGLFFLTSLLEYNCFTMVCQFLLYNKVNQLYICPHISSLLHLPKAILMRRVALLCIFASLFTSGFSCLLLHSVCCNVTYHAGAGKLHCTLVRNEWKRQMTSQYCENVSASQILWKGHRESWCPQPILGKLWSNLEDGRRILLKGLVGGSLTLSYSERPQIWPTPHRMQIPREFNQILSFFFF